MEITEHERVLLVNGSLQGVAFLLILASETLYGRIKVFRPRSA
jgi:hypothetical protein